MSLGVALYNDPQTIEDLQNIIQILNNLPSDFKLDITDNDDVQTINSDNIFRLTDWLEDLVKILTDFSMLSQEEEINV